MRHEIILILAIVICGKTNAHMTGQSPSAESFGHEFTVLFPSNNRSTEDPKISVTLMNPNTRRALVKIIFPGNFSIEVMVDPMNFRTVFFDRVLITICNKTSPGNNLVECSDSRIQITSSLQRISVLAHWYLSDAGDSFLVFPSSMVTAKYSISAPSCPGSITTVYFLPMSNIMTINVTGGIGDKLFTKLFSPKLENGNLTAIQTSKNLTLIATANASFTVIVAVHGLSSGLYDAKTDSGIYMPTPLPNSEGYLTQVSEAFFTQHQENFLIIFDNAIDYHVSLLYDTKDFLVTHDSLSDSPFTVVDETGNFLSYYISNIYQEVKFEGYGQSAGFNSSSAMLQVLRFGGYGISLFNGSFLDLVTAWSQFVTGISTFFVPSNQNIVTIIGNSETTVSMLTGRRVPNQLVWIWVPIPFYDGVFYYTVASLLSGYYAVTSNGSYTIFISGMQGDATYGFVTAYNHQTSKPLPEIKTTVLPTTTTEIPTSSTAATEITTALSTVATETTMAVISTTTESKKEASMGALFSAGLLMSTILFWLIYY
uniref:IgGFc-binding protein N-terminal domain-containing protein n=1 Tax=Onchocerca volvulus TaxID=6282 RepID=A0A8R1XRV8_ONCVO